MASPRNIRLSMPIAALISLTTVAIVLLYAWQITTGHAAEERAMTRESRNLAESLAQQVGASLDETDAVLQRMHFWAAARGVGPAARPLLRDLLRVRTPSMSEIGTLAFVDDRGRVAVRSDPTRSVRPIPGERAAWEYHRTHASPAVTVGAPVRDPITHRWTLTESRRFTDRRGRFAGIVLATVSMESLQQLLSVVDVGRHGVIGLFLDDGTVVSRRSFNGWFIGMRLPVNPIPAALRGAESGTFTSTSAVDGVERYSTIRRVRGYPLTVAVGISVTEAFAAWRSQSVAGLVAVCAVIGLTALLVRFLVVEIRRSSRAQDQLAELAMRDGLTGLANRRQFDLAIERESRVADRDRTELALLMIDVDFFKTYNDRYGHQRGDDVLKAIAGCIRASCARPTDVTARYGGEEFAAILPATPPDGARRVAENIQAALQTLRIVHADNPFGVVTISVGIASRAPGHATAPAEVVRAADAALYAAKRNGRNRIEFANDQPLGVG